MYIRSISIENVLNAADSLGWSKRVGALGRPEQFFVAVTTAKCKDTPHCIFFAVGKKRMILVMRHEIWM